MKTEVTVLIDKNDKDTRRVIYTASEHLPAFFRTMKMQKAVRMAYRNKRKIVLPLIQMIQQLIRQCPESEDYEHTLMK